MEGVGYMKTVRQLSEQLGIAKQSVDYHVKKLNESYIKEGNVNMIDDRLEQLIIERVNNNKQHTTDEQQQTSDNVEDKKEDTSDKDDNVTNVINVLIEQLNSKDDQLNAKDTQIDSLHEQLTAKSKLLENEQSLRLEQINDSKKVAQLENELEQYRLADNRRITNSNSSNVDNRSIKVKKYKVYSSDKDTRPTDESTNEDVEDTKESTNEPIDVSDQTDTNIEDNNTNDQTTESSNTNIEDTESNKRKGFFARLFNL